MAQAMLFSLEKRWSNSPHPNCGRNPINSLVFGSNYPGMPLGEQAVILLVEDSKDDALLVRTALTRASVHNPFFVVGSAEEAIDYLEARGRYSARNEFPLPDLVLLDLKLPGAQGFEVLRAIRRHARLGPLRVIVLTASDSFHDLNEAYELGANSFILKPTQFDDYPKLMRNLASFWLYQSRAPHVERSGANA